MESCLEIARQITNQFYGKNPHLNYDDVFGVSIDAMIKATETFDPEKGRSTKSWTGFLVHRELNKKFGSKSNEKFSEIEFLDYAIENKLYNPERIFLFKEAIENFSDTSKKILSMIFNDELSPKNTGKNEIKREIKKKLRNYGFAWNKIQNAFSELKAYANDV